MKNPLLNRVLVIDDVPIIAFGLLETFTGVNPAVTVEYAENLFSALINSSRTNHTYDLVVVGELPDHSSDILWKMLAEVKLNLGNPRLMLFVSQYDHTVIEKMEQLGIDAYVHRFENMEEVQKAYLRLSFDERYISELFHTLYYDYMIKPSIEMD